MLKKILIIDDNHEGRDNVQTLLDEMGFSTITAKDGIEGIMMATEFIPDLILCDIMMPETNGYAVFRELKKSKKTKNIPFVFLTAKSEYTDFRKGMGLGADDYLIKPYTVEDLLATIDIRLQKSKASLEQNPSLTYQMQNNEPTLEFNENIFLPAKEGYFLLTIKEIDYISSSGAYTNIYYSGNQKVLVRKLLKEWEKMLPIKDFVRVHKSKIINLHSISKIDKWFNSSLKIHLNNYKEPILASRRFSARLKNNIIV